MEDALRAELLAAGIDIGEAMAAAQQQESRSAAAASATSPSTAPGTYHPLIISYLLTNACHMFCVSEAK